MFLKTTKKILDENLKTGSTVIIISRNIPPPIRYLEGYEGSIDVVSATDGPSVDPFTKLRTRIRPPHHLTPKAPSIQDSHVEMEIIQSFSQINGSFVCKNVRNRNWPPDFVAWLSTLRVFFKLILWIRIVISRVWCWQCTLKRVMVVQHAGLLCIAISNRCTSQLIFFLPVINLCCCCCCYQQHIVKGAGDNTLVCHITLSFD